jgi:glucans biosynthesis protein
MLNRREFLRALEAAFALAAVGAAPAMAQAVADDVLLAKPLAFADDTVKNLARQLAAQPYKSEKVKLPEGLSKLSYDQYRDIRFNMDKSIWKGEPPGFSLDLFHTGSFYTTPVDIHIVAEGQARKINYLPELFNFGPSVQAPTDKTDLHYAGMRLRYPLNQTDYQDEFAVFQGASYFRAVAKGQIYGLSARGLAIDTAQPKGEEFPEFRTFWIRKPDPDSPSLVVYALLDSPSCAGAYRFTLRPGDETQMDVELMLVPRVDLQHVGFAPLTSMFYFDDTNRARVDDFRSAVHDSDGLSMQTGQGEWLWRPLSNPSKLQVSAFVDTSPRGFGLMQRKREYNQYLDLEARYERRPSLWVEPVGDWGSGHVELVEIPSDREVNDNIVAYWRPKEVVAKGREFSLTYRLHWCKNWPVNAPGLARAVFAGSGLNMEHTRRQFIVEFTGGDLSGELIADVTASTGEVSRVVPHFNSETGGFRLSFELDPKGADAVELRAQLKRAEKPVTETWLYRWTA